MQYNILGNIRIILPHRETVKPCAMDELNVISPHPLTGFLDGIWLGS